MALFKAPSVRRVSDCSETSAIINNCNEITADSTLSTKMSSQTYLSSSDSNQDGDVRSLNVKESCKEKNDKCPSANDVLSIGVDVSPLIQLSPELNMMDMGAQVSSTSPCLDSSSIPFICRLILFVFFFIYATQESDGDAIYSLIVDEHQPPPIPQKTFFLQRTSVLARDVDNVANYIDIKKVVGKNESNYFYSESNLSSREKLEKIKLMKKQKRRATIDNLDDSVHSRLYLLQHCIRASAYQGPTPRKKDGSHIKSIMKKKYVIRSTCVAMDSTHSSANRSSDASQDSRCKGNVSFSHILIREYERIPGDNPCVRAGVPLSIGWAHYQHKPILLDDYETAKGPPRDKIEMMIPASVRRSMLRDEFGASVNELNAAMKSVNITKSQRAHTLASENVEVLHEVIESVKRKFKRALGKAVSTKKQAEELWEASRDAAMAEYLVKNSGHCLKARETGGELLELDVSHITCDESCDSLHSLDLETTSPTSSSV